MKKLIAFTLLLDSSIHALDISQSEQVIEAIANTNHHVEPGLNLGAMLFNTHC